MQPPRLNFEYLDIWTSFRSQVRSLKCLAREWPRRLLTSAFPTHLPFSPSRAPTNMKITSPAKARQQLKRQGGKTKPTLVPTGPVARLFASADGATVVEVHFGSGSQPRKSQHQPMEGIEPTPTDREAVYEWTKPVPVPEPVTHPSATTENYHTDEEEPEPTPATDPLGQPNAEVRLSTIWICYGPRLT